MHLLKSRGIEQTRILVGNGLESQHLSESIFNRICTNFNVNWVWDTMLLWNIEVGIDH